MNNFILKSDKPDIKRLKKRESLWTQGNGYIGIRSSFEEDYTNAHRTTLINGVFNAPDQEVPELAVLPDVINFEIEINGERFTMISGEVTNYEASLDMKTGEFARKLRWTSPKGDCVDLLFSRIVSEDRKHIVAQRILITPINNKAEIKIVTGIDGKVNNTGVQHFANPQKRVYENGVKGLYAQTFQSKVDVAIHYVLNCNKENNSKTIVDRRSIYTRMVLNLDKNEQAEIEKISSYATSRDVCYSPNEGPDAQVREDGKKYLDDALKQGYKALYEENVKSLGKYWDANSIEIKSENEFLDKAVKFAQYHLYIMANKEDNRLGIGAKALSGEGYKGHSFWDTEIFILPYYIFSNPKIARNLLEYRYQLLGVALAKAKKYGFEGAMYPWETAWLNDGEVVPEYGDLDLVTGEVRRNLMGETEIHITADIAYGVWQYYQATGDVDFMERYGNEIIVLTALYWTSRVEKKNGRYEICGVIGPDEYKENVNNNTYTNHMAWHNMKFAQSILNDCSDELSKKLKSTYNVDADYVKTRIDEVVENIYLPKPEKDGIICQFDGSKELKEIDVTPYKNLEKVGTIFETFGLAEILKMQVYKQADLVMLLYLMGDLFTEEEIRANFEYYEKRTLHDSSLSMCIHALIAARLGNKEMADEMFFKSCCVDLGENTNNSDEGIHSASIGGIWLVLVLGYAGLEVKESGLYLSPVLPDGWDEYSFPLYYKGACLKVNVSREGGCKIEKLSGDEVQIHINGEEYSF